MNGFTIKRDNNSDEKDYFSIAFNQFQNVIKVLVQDIISLKIFLNKYILIKK